MEVETVQIFGGVGFVPPPCLAEPRVLLGKA
jgi:hypothetical protein